MSFRREADPKDTQKSELTTPGADVFRGGFGGWDLAERGQVSSWTWDSWVQMTGLDWGNKLLCGWCKVAFEAHTVGEVQRDRHRQKDVKAES